MFMAATQYQCSIIITTFIAWEDSHHTFTDLVICWPEWLLLECCDSGQNPVIVAWTLFLCTRTVGVKIGFHMYLNRKKAAAPVAAGRQGLHQSFQDTVSTATVAEGFSWVQRHKVTPLIPFSLAYGLWRSLIIKEEYSQSVFKDIWYGKRMPVGS